jgi:hypothetical protein
MKVNLRHGVGCQELRSGAFALRQSPAWGIGLIHTLADGLLTALTFNTPALTFNKLPALSRSALHKNFNSLRKSDIDCAPSLTTADADGYSCH